MILTALSVKNAKPKPYRLSDGKGLYLIVTEKGSKLWRFTYSLNGKRNTMSFGKWPEIELADVRKMRDQARRFVATGRSPLNIRGSRSKPALSWDRSFEAIARNWYTSKELGWTSRCKIACNNDPLRGVFRVQNRPPVTCCVSVLPFGLDRPGRAGGDDWRGQDRRYPASLF